MVSALLVAVSLSSPVGLEASVGTGVTLDPPQAGWDLRASVGARYSSLTVDAFFQGQVAGLVRRGDEGCIELGPEQGGCMHSPMLVGGDVVLHPWTLGRWEPSLFVTGAWARRAVFHWPDPRNDLAVGGGLRIDMLNAPWVFGFSARLLYYATNTARCCGNEGSLFVGVHVGWRSQQP